MALRSEACVPASAAGGESSGTEVSSSSTFLWLFFSLQPGGTEAAPRFHWGRYFTSLQTETAPFQGFKGRRNGVF